MTDKSDSAPQVARTSLSRGLRIISGLRRCSCSSFNVGRSARATVTYRDIIYDPQLRVRLSDPYLDLLNIYSIEGPIPPCWELHARRIGLLILYETDPNNILLFVLEEETDTLESTRVSGPSTRAGHTPRESFRLISVRHTPRKLQLRVQGPSRFSS